MDVGLLDEIRQSDCWDGDVVQAIPLMIVAESAVASELKRANVDRAEKGLLLMTATMFYLMKQVDADDAAIIHEDLTDAVSSIKPLQMDDDELLGTPTVRHLVPTFTHPHGDIVLLTTVDGIRVVVKAVATDGTGEGFSFTRQSLQSCFPSATLVGNPAQAPAASEASVRQSNEDRSLPDASPLAPPPVNLEAFSPPPPPPQLLQQVSPIVARALPLDETSDMASPAPLARTLRGSPRLGGRTSTAVDADGDNERLQAEAEKLKAELGAERERLQSMLDATLRSASTEAVELEEARARLSALTEFHDVAWSIFAASGLSWRHACAVDHGREMKELRALHCSTLRLEDILPDGVSGVHEVPMSADVATLLEQTEKAARANIGAYLTGEQLKSRDRRRRLDVEMATRELRVEIAANARSVAQLRGELATARARCNDLEAAVRARANEVSELRGREQQVIERARRREEELHAQLERVAAGGGRSSGRRPTVSGAHPAAFEFVSA